MGRWTQGSLTVAGILGDIELVVEGGPGRDVIPIARIHRERPDGPSGAPPQQEAFANAYRLLDCWSAMAGIDAPDEWRKLVVEFCRAWVNGGLFDLAADDAARAILAAAGETT